MADVRLEQASPKGLRTFTRIARNFVAVPVGIAIGLLVFRALQHASYELQGRTAFANLIGGDLLTLQFVYNCFELGATFLAANLGVQVAGRISTSRQSAFALIVAMGLGFMLTLEPMIIATDEPPIPFKIELAIQLIFVAFFWMGAMQGLIKIGGLMKDGVTVRVASFGLAVFGAALAFSGTPQALASDMSPLELLEGDVMMYAGLVLIASAAVLSLAPTLKRFAPKL